MVCAIDETAPPGNPLSVPQNAEVYCDSILSGSVADADRADKTASPAMALNNERVPKPPLGDVLEPLDDDLAVFSQWVLVASDDIKN